MCDNAMESHTEMHMVVCVCGKQSAAETKPPNPGFSYLLRPPQRDAGVWCPIPRERAVLLQDAALLCLPIWVAGCLAGRLTDWMSELSVRVRFCAVSEPPCPSCLPPTHSELVVPASTSHSANQAAACLLIMWYPSDSQRGAYGFPVPSGMPIGQQDPP